MKPDIKILRGIHPGFFLEHVLRERKLPKVQFAQSIGEHPQTLVAIMKGKRKMNVPLSLKIEQVLVLEEGLLMQLQVFYEIKEEKQRLSQAISPDLSKIRSILFWDTVLEKIDWQRQKRAVIRRVFERGNASEKAEIKRFYGQEVTSAVLSGEVNAADL